MIDDVAYREALSWEPKVELREPPDDYWPANVPSDDGYWEELHLDTWAGGAIRPRIKFFTRFLNYTTECEIVGGSVVVFAIWVMVMEDDEAFCVYVDAEGDVIDRRGFVIHPWYPQ